MKKEDVIDGFSTPPELTRRGALRLLGAALATAPLANMFGCRPLVGNEGEPNDQECGELRKWSRSDAGVGCEDGSDAGAVQGWASGGTAAMTALASYPNPFNAPVDTTCTPTCEMMLGPCHDQQAPEREDISEGQTGLPIRFGLRFLDDKCEPVVDADVDIWHCDVRGIYSSATNDTPSFCTGDEPEALAARYFRGHRKTDKNGVVWFNTCFPGWYNGRAIHIHYTVRRPSRSGEEWLTSQIGFPMDLTVELCGSHPDYVAHGQPNTTIEADPIIPNEEIYLADTARMKDGALLATKTFILRSSLSTTLCAEGPLGLPPGFPGSPAGGG